MSKTYPSTDANNELQSGARMIRRRGFTLVELMTVVVIIGIILSLILVAGMDAANRSYERATQSLITKLDQAMSDRLEALLQTRPDYNSAHIYLAGGILGANPPITRAQVIAWYDYVKAELPDVFFIQNDANYKLNFTGVAMQGTDNSGILATYAQYVLPIGNTLVNNPTNNSYGDSNQTNPDLGYVGSGIFGASYTAAAGIYKNLGYLPAGYDGIDNNGNTYVDEWAEGVTSSNQAQVETNLSNHKHSTARAEMLYALLVEGRGPLGSVFSPDDFTSKEVQDTDGDGLPEFVDAWGNPLQFFRWPLLYHSDIQRGQVVNATGGSSWALGPPYGTVYETREQDPLDPNQQLVAPAWWFSANYGGYSIAITGAPPVLSTASVGVQAFQALFHPLTEPYPYPPPASSSYSFANYWDRSTTTGYGSRRAFYSKFLIVSGGPDSTPGVFLYSDAALANAPSPASALIANENNAMPFALDVADFTASATLSNLSIPVNSNNPSSYDPTNPTSYDLQQAAQDDISNQNLAAVGNIGGSG